MYCGLVCAVFYSFFEFFPLVFGSTYNMTLREIGLVFISIIIEVCLSKISYALFTHSSSIEPLKLEHSCPPEADSSQPSSPQSSCLRGCLYSPRHRDQNIHWIVPTIGTILVSGNAVVII
ncbi:hypothetical protein BDW71DRAFT_183468 [Aspergillus fruticulosus]